MTLSTQKPPSAGSLTSSQKFLIQACMDILKLEAVSLDDNFFEIGGDSLLALAVYDRVLQHYQQEIPLFDLSLDASIRNLATVIDQALERDEEINYRSLKCLNRGDPDITPLFIVHGGDGNAQVFRRLLVCHLDTRIPVYAFRWSGWDGQRGDASLRAMVHTYVEELNRYRPEGPVRIGGYCIGGVVALQMARLLKESGRTIEGPLLIWDAPNFHSASYFRREPWYSASDYIRFKNMVAELETHRKVSKGSCEPLDVPAGFSGSFELLRRYPNLFTIARTLQILLITTFPIRLRLLLGKPIPVKLRWLYCMTTMFFALRERFEGRFEGPVVYFRSDVILGRPMNTQGWWADPFMGFGELCSEDFQGYAVGGNHISILGQPECAQIVTELYFGSNECTT